jgi:hypothetical protein
VVLAGDIGVWVMGVEWYFPLIVREKEQRILKKFGLRNRMFFDRYRQSPSFVSTPMHI